MAHARCPRRIDLPLSVILITLMAWVARVAGLPTVQGTMGRDESRLVLAAWGILDHGIPLLPGGFVYTRGLLPAYLEAVSIALLGGSDQAARLPNMVFATCWCPPFTSLVGTSWTSRGPRCRRDRGALATAGTSRPRGMALLGAAVLDDGVAGLAGA